MKYPKLTMVGIIITMFAFYTLASSYPIGSAQASCAPIRLGTYHYLSMCHGRSISSQR